MGKATEPQFIFAFDVETTGLCFNSDSPVLNNDTGERHQILSIGIIIVNAKTLKPIEDRYIEIKWNDVSLQQRKDDPKFGTFAEKVHGLTFAHLEEHGVDEEEAVLEIANLIVKYWGTTTITVMGHNVMTFDVPFLRDMMDRYEVAPRVAHRHCDASAAGFAAFGISTSDGLIELLGFDDREEHNALDDITYSLKVFQSIRKIVNSVI